MFTYFWIIVAIIALMIELMTAVALTSVWFVVGAIAAALLSLFSIGFLWQCVVFVVVSIVALLLLRPFLVEKLRGNTVATNYDRVVGKHTALTKAITKEQWGCIKINGSEWSCVNINDEELPIGTEVKILAVDGSKLIVEKL